MFDERLHGRAFVFDLAALGRCDLDHAVRERPQRQRGDEWIADVRTNRAVGHAAQQRFDDDLVDAMAGDFAGRFVGCAW